MISLEWYQVIAIAVCYIVCRWTCRIVVSRMIYKSIFCRPPKVEFIAPLKLPRRRYTLKDRIIPSVFQGGTGHGKTFKYEEVDEYEEVADHE